MLAVTSATGKLGSAVLKAILDNDMIPTSELVVCTSSDPSSPRFDALRSKNITIRHADFDSPSTLESAFQSCTHLFLVSTPRISMDFNSAPLWSGREAHHRAAIDAALQAGVTHITYTSLAFGNPSKAGVMRAHIRTEKYLADLAAQGKLTFTVLREGLYNESWPLYFGYFWKMRDEKRTKIVVAGDGRISWTAIEDMAFATARIITAKGEEAEKWRGKTVYLAQAKTWSLDDVARMVSRAKGEDLTLELVDKEEYVEHYVGKGVEERPSVEWWSSTYDALKDGECEIKDPTLEEILAAAGRTPKTLDVTIEEMMG